MKKQMWFTDEEIKELIEIAPKIIKKSFLTILDKQRLIEEKRKKLREELNRGARKGKTEPV